MLSASLLEDGNAAVKPAGEDDIPTDKKSVIISLLALILSVPALIGA